ncbi:MAG: dipeptidase [Limnochordia bacterium]|jgi:membrane dipeptidase
MPIFDAHCDTLLTARQEGRFIHCREERGHVDFPRLREGGIAWQVLAICAGQGPVSPLAQVLIALRDLEQALEADREAHLIKSAADFQREGLGLLLALEGGRPLEGSTEILELLYSLGLRSLGLTWNEANDLAVGVGAGPEGGLTPRGRKIVGRAAQLGMVLDVSHLNERSFWDLLDCPGQPIASHSNCRALCDHPRNLTDRQIKALASRNGVIGIAFYPPFLTAEGRAQVSHIVDHVVHIASLVGVDHVGLGSDFDGMEQLPLGIEDCRSFPNIIVGLKEAGFSSPELEKILWKNWRRVYERAMHGRE